jgi:hypothetical protein
VGDGRRMGIPCVRMRENSLVEKNSPEKVTGVDTDINCVSDLPRFSMGRFKEKAAAAHCLIGDCPREDDAGASDGGL